MTTYSAKEPNMAVRLLLMLHIALCGASSALAGEEKPQLMFVQTAGSFTAEGQTLRLINVGQQTL